MNILGKNCTETEKQNLLSLIGCFDQSSIPTWIKLRSFPVFVRRQDIARFLARHELFKLALPVMGSVVECGVWAGAGIATYMHLSNIYEPVNYIRKIIGFDTFEGFPEIDPQDHPELPKASEFLHKGGLKINDGVFKELVRIFEVQNQNRPIGHIPKVELIQGNASVTIPQYLKDNPHLLVSLLYLDFDIYKPTKDALKALLPRVVKGGVVAFDELNMADFPGETIAMIEEIVPVPKLRRFPFDPNISYFIKE